MVRYGVVYSTERSPNFSYSHSQYAPIRVILWGDAPCIQELPSDPEKPAWKSSRQWRARQRQPRPIALYQHHVLRARIPHRVQPVNTYNRELLKAPCLLNVLQSLGQILQFQVDLLLGSLGVLDSLSLKGLDSLELAVEVVCGGLEGVEALLNLVDDGLVLEGGPVVGKVDSSRQLGQLLNLALGGVVTRLEGLQRGHGLPAQAERGGHAGPVELEGRGSLGGEISSCWGEVRHRGRRVGAAPGYGGRKSGGYRGCRANLMDQLIG